MKPFLKHLFLLVLIFFIVDKGFYYFIHHASNKESDKRLEFIVKGEMNKDILILGSSRGANNIVAKQIEDKTQFSTYNLSYIGSNIEFHEYVLSSVLKFNKPPQKVFLVIDHVFEFVENSTLSFRVDRLLPLKKYNYFNNELIKRGVKNELSRVFCLSRIDRSDFKLGRVKKGIYNTLTPNGSILHTVKQKSNITYDYNPKRYSKAKEKFEKIEALKKIKSLCKLNNIELVFVFTPNFQRFNSSFFSRFSEFVDNEKVLVYDTLNFKYKNNIYYKDASHLLKNGAELFTNEIIDFINQNKNTTNRF